MKKLEVHAKMYLEIPYIPTKMMSLSSLEFLQLHCKGEYGPIYFLFSLNYNFVATIIFHQWDTSNSNTYICNYINIMKNFIINSWTKCNMTRNKCTNL